MDLSKLSNEELIALKSGDLSKLSNEALLALRGGSVPTATTPALQRTLGQQAGRALGLTGRALVQGATAIPSMVADPVVAIANKLTGQNQPLPSKAISQTLTNIGLPQYETAGEKIVGGINEAVTSAGGLIGAGKMMVQKSPNAMLNVVDKVGPQFVGKALSAAPLAQMGAAAGSAGAGQAAREADLGPFAELAASLAGGMAGGRVGGAFDINKTPPAPRKMTPEDFKNQARASYEEARASSSTLKPEAVNQFIDTAGELGTRTAAGRLIEGGQDPFSVIYGRMTQLRDRPLSIDEIDDIDKVLTREIDKYTELGRIKGEGLPLLQLRDNFRQFVNTIPENLVEGGSAGYQALKNARSDWSTSLKLADVERILGRQGMYPQDSTAVQSGFRSLFQNPSKMSGYSPAEKEAVKVAAGYGGPVAQLLKPAASRLTSIAQGAVGGPVGYLMGTGASALARQGVDAEKMRQANAVYDLIANARPMQAPKFDPQYIARILGTAIGTNQ